MSEGRYRRNERRQSVHTSLCTLCCWLRRRVVSGLLRQAERGEASSFEFVGAIMPIMMCILLIAFATIVRASEMPAWSAASECARTAIASEDETNGREQGELAAMNSLLGNSILATSGQIEITGDWTPGSLITCRVSYDIDVSNLDFTGVWGGKVPISAEVSLRVEPYKSRWQ